MINFVDIALQDANYLNEHDQLDALLAEGWHIIGHSVYTDLDGDPYERYTLHIADKDFLAEQLQPAYGAKGKS